MSQIAGAGIDLDDAGAMGRQRIMVVEDEADTIFLLKNILRMAGYNVMSASGGEEALQKIGLHEPDLILLDVMMPEMDGWQAFEYIQKMTKAPVIFISALSSKEHIIKGLRAGVDDYITKPFHNEEVVERVRAVLRRAGRAKEVTRFVFPKIKMVVDIKGQQVQLADENIHLTAKEFAVLAVLAKHAPQIVNYQTISESVWGADSSEARKRAKYLVYLLRRKFSEVLPHEELILNVDRLGYRLNSAD
ncbi:MAG: response regulator transcription factor [Anaerolineaceae bacterium]|jgi:DNA-binding response OmpR family regulator|nr:response regulator transcription factor [Anaerolineaceae bacterium]